MRHARRLVAALVPLVCTITRAAHADPSGEQKAAAQVLFESGRALVEQGRFAEACPKLAESEKLDPGIGTMLWLADCYENNGQLASAWATFDEAASTAEQAGDKRAQVARERAKALEPKLPRLTIVVPPEAASMGIIVARDGIPIGTPQWGLPVPADPGVHTVSARAEGHESWTTTVQLEPRAQTLQVTIPVLAPTRGAPASTRNAPPPLAPSAPTPPWRGERTLGLALAGVGLAGLAVGAAFGVAAIVDKSGAHCGADDLCDPGSSAGIKRAALVSDIGWIAGGVLVAAGVSFVLLAPSGHLASTSAWRVAPAVGLGGGGVTIGGAF